MRLLFPVLLAACSQSVVGDGEPANNVPSPAEAQSPVKTETPAPSADTVQQPSTPPDLRGSYCGRLVDAAPKCTGDDVFYARILSSGTLVAGEFCEAFAKDCMALENGTVDGNAFRFEVTPSGGNHVNCALTITHEKALVGSCAAAGDTIPLTLFPVP